MYKDGALVKDIARHLRTTEASVRRALRDQGVQVDPQQRAKANYRRRVLDDTDITLIRLYRSQGMSWREVGEAMEVPFNTARNAFLRWQLEQLQRERGHGA